VSEAQLVEVSLSCSEFPSALSDQLDIGSERRLQLVDLPLGVSDGPIVSRSRAY